MPGHKESVSSETPYKQHIPRKNKRKKTPYTLITRKEILKNWTTQVKGKKRIIYLMQKKNQIKTPAPFKNLEDYIGDTDKKTRSSNDFPSETDGCAKNLGKEHENEKGEEFSENTPQINDSIK